MLDFHRLTDGKRKQKKKGVFFSLQIFPHALLQERESLARRQMLEEERRRREEAEKRLQDETFHRQQLVEKEVKMRARNFSQVSEAPAPDGGLGGAATWCSEGEAVCLFR